MTIQKYSIDLVYCPGKELVIADALTRAYLPEKSDMPPHTDSEVNVLCTLPISNSKLLQLQIEIQSDPMLQQLKTMVEKGGQSINVKCHNSIHHFGVYVIRYLSIMAW